MSQDSSALYDAMVKNALGLLGDDGQLNKARLSATKAFQRFLDAKADLAKAMGQDPTKDHSARITALRVAIGQIDRALQELVESMQSTLKGLVLKAQGEVSP